MEPEGSLPYSQAPATCPYPEPTPSVPTTPSHFLKIHLNIILPSTYQFSFGVGGAEEFPSSPITYRTGKHLIYRMEGNLWEFPWNSLPNRKYFWDTQPPCWCAVISCTPVIVRVTNPSCHCLSAIKIGTRDTGLKMKLYFYSLLLPSFLTASRDCLLLLTEAWIKPELIHDL